MSVMKIEAEKTLIELCEKFIEMFSELQEIINEKYEFEQENQKYFESLTLQRKQSEDNIRQLQFEILELQNQIQNGQEIKDSGEFQRMQEKYSFYFKELEHKKKLLAQVKVKKHSMFDQNEQHFQELSNDNEKLDFLRTQAEEIDDKMEILTKNLIDLESEISELNEEKIFYEGKISSGIELLEENEITLRAEIDEKFKMKDDYQMSAQEFRKLLASKHELNSAIQIINKKITKYGDELSSKIQRLEALNAFNKKQTEKICRFEVLNEKMDENSAMMLDLERQTSELKLKYERIIGEPWDRNCEYRLRKMIDEIVGNKNFSIEKSREYSEYSEKEDSYFNELLMAVSQGNKEKDDDIVRNEEYIQEIQHEINQERNNLYIYQVEKEVILQKLHSAGFGVESNSELRNSNSKIIEIEEENSNFKCPIPENKEFSSEEQIYEQNEEPESQLYQRSLKYEGHENKLLSFKNI